MFQAYTNAFKLGKSPVAIYNRAKVRKSIIKNLSVLCGSMQSKRSSNRFKRSFKAF